VGNDRRQIIIDTDPGVDDAMAIALALASPELEVRALTTVFGNHWLPETTRNARVVVEQLGHGSVPVVRGAAMPLVRRFDRPATLVHGEDGLGDAGHPEPARGPERALRAASFLADAVLSRPGHVTLVLIGPLTNAALALRLEPEIAEAVDEVVIMGGAALVAGNSTPAAEANILADPEAAQVVFEAGWDVTMVGLDVTQRVLIDDAWLDRLAAGTGAAARFLTEIVGPYRRHHGELGGIHGHDVLAVAHLLDPSLLTLEPYPLRVSTSGPTTGETVVATRATRDPDWADAPVVRVATGVDSPRLLALTAERLAV
jgi:inosine-uridine nucleoside N-ribohydrolase